ncbi:uncharacterized protein TRAVEDRAFT_107333, partial [Trametes versicolor FP-101664 SS1]|uniref:uncharacterized protein n=1 Tax=Trametes versicolor (strain FP-101664) TaxID=717944 RepID=UPI0004622A0C
MALPAGMPTLEASRTKNLTRPDNVFCTEYLQEAVVRCKVAPHLRPPKTDHFPILLTLGIPVEESARTTRRNFREVDWEAFNETLRAELAARPPPIVIITTANLDRALSRLTAALQVAIDRHVPETVICPFTKRWWSKDLDKMRRETKRLGRESYRYRGDAGHRAHRKYKVARNRY